MKRARPARFILAIDQGTTGTLALLFDRRFRIASQAYRPLPQHFPRPGWVEHDPFEILATARQAVRDALEKIRASSAQIASIGITNQRETFVLWNRRTGKPLHRAIVWQCRRSSALCDRLKQEGLEFVFREKTGLVLDPYFSGTKIRWLFEEHPDMARACRRGEILFGTVDTWLLWNLTGGAVHATDPTNASRTLLFHLEHKEWDAELMKILKVPRAILPEVRPSASDFGRTKRFGALEPGIPIGALCGDQQASLFGHGCFNSNRLKNTYGTGCFLLLNTEDRLVRSHSGLLTTLVCNSEGKPAYGLEGSVFISGAAVQWLRDGLRIIKTAHETEKMAQSVPDTGGVTVVPAFTGLGAPYWDAQARGAILGITRGTKIAHIVRATLESIAFQTKDVAEAFAKDAHAQIRELHVDGGSAQNDFLMQFQSDLLNVPIIRPQTIAMTATGAGLLAAIPSGLLEGSVEKLALRDHERVFRPRMKESERREAYERWRRAVYKILERR